MGVWRRRRGRVKEIEDELAEVGFDEGLGEEEGFGFDGEGEKGGRVMVVDYDGAGRGFVGEAARRGRGKMDRVGG